MLRAIEALRAEQREINLGSLEISAEGADPAFVHSSKPVCGREICRPGLVRKAKSTFRLEKGRGQASLAWNARLEASFIRLNSCFQAVRLAPSLLKLRPVALKLLNCGD